MSFTPPNLEYSALAPMLVIFAAAIIGVIVEAFVSAKLRGPLQLAIALGATILSFSQVLSLRGTQTATAAMDSVIIDGPVLFMQGTILVFAFLGLLLIADLEQFAPQASAIPGSSEEASAIKVGKTQTEIYPLTLFAVGGMMLFPAASDLITLFIALEVLSLPLYLMAGLSRRRRLLSQEAALKYFLLGAYSSAFFLFGSAFLYGYAGTVSLEGIHNLISSGPGNDIFLLIGIAALSVGLLFKMGAVPFHAWTPDVYQGAPTAVLAFFGTVVKFSTIMALIFLSLNIPSAILGKIMLIVAMASIIVGSFGAIFQKNIKRLLAFSSVGHIGFVLLALSVLDKRAVSASIFYMIIYSFISLGTFGFLSIMRSKSNEDNDIIDNKIFDINSLSGLAKTHPVMAFALSVLMFSTAGIPPFAGFFSKFYILENVVGFGLLIFAIIAVVFSAISAFYYLRIVKIMYFNEPNEDLELEDFGNARLIILISAIFNIFAIFGAEIILNSINNFIN